MERQRPSDFLSEVLSGLADLVEGDRVRLLKAAETPPGPARIDALEAAFSEVSADDS
jgi:hypothetical protein